MLDDFIPYLQHHQKLAPQVSAWTVGQQIQHVILATDTVIAQMESPKPQPYRYQFSIPRLFCFTLGTIPRGKGKAPQDMIPSAPPTLEQLTAGLERGPQFQQRYDALPLTAWWTHPVFGRLNKRKNNRLITVHNNHHLKIIRDIVSAA